MLTPVSVSAHTQDFWFPATFPTTALYPRRFHSQKVTYPSPPHHTLEKPGVPSQAPPPAFFWKAVKMLKLFWSSSFFPSLVLFFSTSLVIRVSSDAGKSPWVTIFAMILRCRLAHFLLVSFMLTGSPAPASRGTGRLRWTPQQRCHMQAGNQAFLGRAHVSSASTGWLQP